MTPGAALAAKVLIAMVQLATALVTLSLQFPLPSTKAVPGAAVPVGFPQLCCSV